MRGIQILLFITLVMTSISDPGDEHTCASHGGQCVLSRPCPQFYTYDQYHLCPDRQLCCLPDVIDFT